MPLTYCTDAPQDEKQGARSRSERERQLGLARIKLEEIVASVHLGSHVVVICDNFKNALWEFFY